MRADWAMVIITGIYVAATIGILITNRKATKATEEQLREMCREFEMINRPIIETEIVYLNKAVLALRLKNNGTHTAQHVKLVLDRSFSDSVLNPSMARLLKEQVDKECIIGVGQYHDVFFGDNDFIKQAEKPPIRGLIEYCCGEKKYSEHFSIDIENYMTIFSIESDDEKLRKLIKDQNRILKQIRIEVAQLKCAASMDE